MKFEGFESEPLYDLPVSPEEFNKFCDEIFEEHSFPKADSYKQLVASMIMHLDNTTTQAPKLYFAKAIKKAQANEVAYHVIQDCRDKQIKEEAEKKERLALEANKVATTEAEASVEPVSN